MKKKRAFFFRSPSSHNKERTKRKDSDFDIYTRSRIQEIMKKLQLKYISFRGIFIENL